MAKSIAVLGASDDRTKFGNKCVRAYAAAGWEVFPINLSADRIEGLAVHRRLADLPVELDRISVYLKPATTRAVLAEIAAQAAGEVWFNPGSVTAEVAAEALDLGIPVVEACSIVDIGLSPAMFP